MTAANYEELRTHVGHDIECVQYGKRNAALECETCNVVLLDYDKLTEERTFIVHPDGTDEIYNLQIVEESELPAFFGQFIVNDSSEPEEYRDSHWTDVADRWRFYNATHLSESRIDEIVESHNQKAEEILEPMDFTVFKEIGARVPR